MRRHSHPIRHETTSFHVSLVGKKMRHAVRLKLSDQKIPCLVFENHVGPRQVNRIERVGIETPDKGVNLRRPVENDKFSVYSEFFLGSRKIGPCREMGNPDCVRKYADAPRSGKCISQYFERLLHDRDVVCKSGGISLSRPQAVYDIELQWITHGAKDQRNVLDISLGAPGDIRRCGHKYKGVAGDGLHHRRIKPTFIRNVDRDYFHSDPIAKYAVSAKCTPELVQSLALRALAIVQKQHEETGVGARQWRRSFLGKCARPQRRYRHCHGDLMEAISTVHAIVLSVVPTQCSLFPT